MRILIYGINYWPELTGVGKYTGEMAEWLAESGHQVRVVTAPPYYPAWQVARDYRAWAYTREQHGRVEVFRCPLWVKQQPNSLERLLHLLSFVLASLPVILAQVFWRPDIVLSVEPPLFCAPVALLVARLCGARSWLHIQDYEVDAAFGLRSLPSQQWLVDLAHAFESATMRAFDTVSTISAQMCARAILKGIPRSRLALLPNWVDTDAIYPNSSGNHLRAYLGLVPEDLVVLYSGNMGGKQGLDLLLTAADQLRHERHIRFVLCGDGTARMRLQQQAEQMQLDNMQFLPLQPVERLNELLNLADVHVLVQRDAPADLVMPSKLCGMLASGRPVIATARPDTAVGEVFDRARCGLLVPPENADALVEALRQLAADPGHGLTYGHNGRLWAERHLDKREILSALHEWLCKLHNPGDQTRSSLESASGTLRTADVDEVRPWKKPLA